MRIRLFAATLSAAVLSAGVLAGCAGQSTPMPQSSPKTRSPSSSMAEPPESTTSPGSSVELEGSPVLEEIRERGKLMVGLRSADPAFAIRKGPGEYGGFDVEIAKIIARGIGMNPETDIAYRWLPPSLLTDAMVAGNVDIQIGGFDPAAPKTAEVGPYIVTGDVRHFIGIRPGDPVLRAELQHMLDLGIADGSWQRAYDSTLGKAGIEGTPR